MPGEISPTGNHSGRSAKPALRASHTDRDRVAEQLRVAAGDGRLTSEELDERLEAALSARTVAELAELTVDLPPVALFGGGAAAQAKDLLRLDEKWSTVKRAGRWVVPRRLELALEWCDVTLDFTQAVITEDTLLIDLDMQGKTLTLITRPGIHVDTDGLTLHFTKVRDRQPDDPATPVRLRVEIVGKKSFGRVVVRPPRRTAGQWIRRERPALPAAD
ncbi:DUF1707 domain-containing protein [Kitasatospora sp. NPDC056446]|uniref:DUF1707 SHOCT-like domain-containing protein n=1 Tax=Kitasatospora sp. NPDC056446 TaxID=3345819 RepID=UPI0036CA0FFE